MIENKLLDKLNSEVKCFLDNNITIENKIEPELNCTKRFKPERLITDSNTIDAKVLENFRRPQIFFGDSPWFDREDKSVDKIKFNTERQKAKFLVAIFEEHECQRLIFEFPTPLVGNPCLFKPKLAGKKTRFTHRWLKHLYSLLMFDNHIDDRLEENFISLDIGAGYGIFQYLVRHRRPDSHQILVDFSKNLLLTRYFLQSCFPDATIAGIEEIIDQESLGRDFISQYDFILLPISFYTRLEGGAVDLATSFACLGELNRNDFNYYTEHNVFKQAKIYYLVNPLAATKSEIVSESDITLLDYDCIDRDRTILFTQSPVHIWRYTPRFAPLPAFFEYIGYGEA